MRCPFCNKEIERVIVYSECYQYGYLSGKAIIDYGSVQEVLETIDIECPECGNSLKGLVEET